MPRKARIDTPGALHHIISRGIEQRDIFWMDADRNDFVTRLGTILSETQTPCYAWALLPNHFHLLIRTGNAPIAKVMRRLLSGYAGSFNRRHGRSGHLFQNRYKSILCQEDLYLLELVRYIHLNPLRAKLVTTLKELERYIYCGHGVIVGCHENDWQDTNTVLGLFGKRISSARRRYRLFVEKGIAMGKRSELTGGGLIRSMGGWAEVKALGRHRIHLKGDERILGDSDFVESVLKEQHEVMERRYWLRAQGFDFFQVVERVAKISGMDAGDILRTGKQPERVRARSLACYWAVNELRMTTVAVSKMLGISQTGVTKAVHRGGKIAEKDDLQLIESRNE